MTPDEQPIADGEILLRRVPSDPAKFIFPDGPTQYQAFLPNSNDLDGLSLNRELYESAESLLQKAANPKVVQFGGVVAVAAGVPRILGADVMPDPEPESVGHCIIEKMSRKRYDSSKAEKKEIQFLADEMARASFVRIQPKPLPLPS